MQITVTNPKTGIKYQYDVEDLHLALPSEQSQRIIRAYFSCTIKSGEEIVNPKTRDNQPLEIPLNNSVDPRVTQAMGLLKEVIEEAQQKRALKMHTSAGSNSPPPSSRPI